MIKDRNLNPETETARGKHQEYTSRELGNNFLNITPTVQKLAPRINREDHIKFQSFCTAKRKLPGQQTSSPENGRKSSPTILQTGN